MSGNNMQQDLFTPRKKKTQEQLVLSILTENDVVSTAYFEKYMTTSAFHRAIWNLENRMGYKGKIDHLEKDEMGFRHYRLKKEYKNSVNINPIQTRLFIPSRMLG